MNAVIYARYSSDNQQEESIDGQLRECKEYADQNGITVVRTYIDRALSAKTDSRPQFQQMIHDSATHTFEAVLVWKLDRFSRNRYDSAHYKRILKNNRVHVVSVTEPISNTPEGIMLESLLEGMAEYYSAELAEKVSRGHKENALKAKFNGGPVPLGYRIDSQHHYQIDPATAPVVQEAFQRYAAGESIRSIIESLNARGIRNSRGNPFTKNSFQTLLKNRRYLGEYRYKDTVIPNAIPAIIAPECFDAVQRRCEIHRQAPAHNKSDVHYLLTTKLFCGKCGTMMAGESGRSHTGTVHCYYKCGTRKRGGREACSLKPVRKEPLEQFVVQTALEKVLNDRVVDLLVDKLLEYQSRENTRLPVLQAELKEVKRRIDNLVAAIEQGILTPSTRARMDELEQQRKALETSVLKEQIEKPPITREQILFWFDQFRHGDPADMAFQEKVIDCFVNSIYLFDDRIVLNFNYQEGGRPVSLEEVLGSFLDGRGAPQNIRSGDCLDGFFIVQSYGKRGRKRMGPKYYQAYDLRYRQVHQNDLQWASDAPTPIVGEILRRMPLSDGARLLEIGCGEGRDAFALLKQGFDLLATDVSLEAVRYCREKMPAFADRFQVLDCVAGAWDETFDFVYAVAVLHMLVKEEDRRGFYRFIRNHLKPNGIGLICTMGDGETERQSDIQRAFEAEERTHQGTGQKLRLAGTSCRMVSFATFEKELADSGLKAAQKGLTEAPPDFSQLMYAVVQRA